MEKVSYVRTMFLSIVSVFAEGIPAVPEYRIVTASSYSVAILHKVIALCFTSCCAPMGGAMDKTVGVEIELANQEHEDGDEAAEILAVEGQIGHAAEPNDDEDVDRDETERAGLHKYLL